MKKTAFFFILIMTISFSSKGQIISVKTGVSQTSLHGYFDYERYSDNPLFVGLDHEFNKRLSISSEAGILTKGGKLANSTDLSGKPVIVYFKMKTLEVYPLIKYTPVCIGNVSFYCGAGPKFDIHIDKDYKMPELYSGYEKFAKCTFGAIATAGAYYDYSLLRLGLSYAYNFDLTDTETNYNAKNKMHLFCISIGYKFIK